MAKYKVSVKRAIELEKWLIDNYKNGIDMNEKLYNSMDIFDYDEMMYLLEANKIPLYEMIPLINDYDNKKYPNALIFNDMLSQKYKVRTGVIIKRIAYTRAIMKHLEKHPELTLLNVQIFNKLVRDNIIDKIERNGETAIYHILDDNDYWQSLLLKDREELEEVKNSKTPLEMKEELADKLEVLRAMAEYQGFNLDDILLEADKKKDVKGGFSIRLYLERTYRK